MPPPSHECRTPDTRPGAAQARRYYSLPGTLAKSELRDPSALRIPSGFRGALGVERPVNPQLVDPMTPWIPPHPLVGDQAGAQEPLQQENHLRAHTVASVSHTS